MVAATASSLPGGSSFFSLRILDQNSGLIDPLDPDIVFLEGSSNTTRLSPYWKVAHSTKYVLESRYDHAGQYRLQHN